MIRSPNTTCQDNKSSQCGSYGIVAVGGDPPIWGNIQAFPTPERFLGSDLNGDGDTNDTVLRYRNLEIGEVVNTGLIVSGASRAIDIYENIIAFVGEGGRIRYYDINTGTVGETGATGSHPSIYRNIIAFNPLSTMRTISYFDLSTQVLTNTEVQGGDPVVFGDLIAFSWFSGGGQSTIRYYDLRTGSVTDTGVVGYQPSLYENRIAFLTHELGVGEDLNGDGDTSDQVIRVYDLTTRAVTNTGAVSNLFPAIYGNRIAFATPESAVNQDLNGDGKIVGDVIQYYDLTTGQVINTRELGTEPDIYEDTISYYLWESWTAADLNGDGDQGDPIVSVYQIALTETETAPTGSGRPVGAGTAGGLSLALLALVGVALGRRLLS